MSRGPFDNLAGSWLSQSGAMGALDCHEREENPCMRFLMIMIPEVYRKAAAAEFVPAPEAVRKMEEYNEKMRKAGILLALDGLTPPAAGARVSFAGGKVTVTDGPFAETKEAIGGYWMIQVGSRDEAIEWARRCPAGANDIIEIRRVYEPEDFG